MRRQEADSEKLAFNYVKNTFYIGHFKIKVFS